MISKNAAQANKDLVIAARILVKWQKEHQPFVFNLTGQDKNWNTAIERKIRNILIKALPKTKFSQRDSEDLDLRPLLIDVKASKITSKAPTMSMTSINRKIEEDLIELYTDKQGKIRVQRFGFGVIWATFEKPKVGTLGKLHAIKYYKPENLSSMTWRLNLMGSTDIPKRFRT